MTLSKDLLKDSEVLDKVNEARVAHKLDPYEGLDSLVATEAFYDDVRVDRDGRIYSRAADGQGEDNAFLDTTYLLPITSDRPNVRGFINPGRSVLGMSGSDVSGPVAFGASAGNKTILLSLAAEAAAIHPQDTLLEIGAGVVDGRHELLQHDVLAKPAAPATGLDGLELAPAHRKHHVDTGRFHVHQLLLVPRDAGVAVVGAIGIGGPHRRRDEPERVGPAAPVLAVVPVVLVAKSGCPNTSVAACPLVHGPMALATDAAPSASTPASRTAMKNR